MPPQSPEVRGSERCAVPIGERVLAHVDDLLEHRRADGTYDPQALRDIRQNIFTAAQEAAMPYAVTETRHARAERGGGRTFIWLGRTAVEAAMSGHDFHRAEAAHARVDVEVDEALHSEQDLRPGVMKLFISPRMSHQDAPRWVAEEEHLDQDDAVRASWLVTDASGVVTERVMQSLLVRDVPLEAWVAMLKDPGNIFGKSILVEDEDSALSVMQAHRELELPIGVLPNGPVGLVEAVIPYIADPATRRKVMEHARRFQGDQEILKREAELATNEWLAFDKELANSLVTGTSTSEIRSFIIGMQHEWGDKDLAVIRNHELSNASYRMSRSLATVLEKAKQNTLWSKAAVMTDNPFVLKQLSVKKAEQIKTNEQLARIAKSNGMDYRALEMQNQRIIARQNIKVGGGCPGKNKASFLERMLNKNRFKDLEKYDLDQLNEDALEEDKENWKWKKGVCRVEVCSTRPGETEVGPCDVCRGCQAVFDAGKDPTKTGNLTKKANKVTGAAKHLGGMISGMLNKETKQKDQKSSSHTSGKHATLEAAL